MEQLIERNGIDMAQVDGGVVAEIVRKSKSGNQVFFKRMDATQCRIKVQHGPFGLMTTRYTTNAETYEAVLIMLGRSSSRMPTPASN